MQTTKKINQLLEHSTPAGTDLLPVADPTTGLLKKMAISQLSALVAPPAENLYTDDGTLAGNRVVTMGAYSLTFEKDIIINQSVIGNGTSQYNNRFGVAALASCTTGLCNVAVGWNSLTASLNGDNNTAVGYGTMVSNLYGDDNVAIGVDALSFNTSGGGNIAIGAGASSHWYRGNSTGWENIFIGYYCNGEGATDSYRTWIGNDNTQATWLGGNLLLGTKVNSSYIIDAIGDARIIGKLAVGTPSAASAALEVTSTYQGFLPPRMTTTQKNAISSPAAGLVVYDTTLGKLCVRTASAWQTITSA